MRDKGYVLLLSLWLLLTGTAAAQECQECVDRTPHPSIRVTSQAMVTSRPDQAQIDLGVVTQAPTAQAAASQNAQQLDAVVAALRQALDPQASIETLSYTLSPQYRYPQEGQPPILSGYTATNTVQVKIDDLAEASTVIDVALRAGANQVNRLQFTLKNEQSVQAQALRKAARQARAQADALAAALGLEPGRILSVTESEQSVVQPLGAAAMQMRTEAFAAPTPIEPGMIEVRATVTLTVAISEAPRPPGDPSAPQGHDSTSKSEDIPAP